MTIKKQKNKKPRVQKKDNEGLSVPSSPPKPALASHYENDVAEKFKLTVENCASKTSDNGSLAILLSSLAKVYDTRKARQQRIAVSRNRVTGRTNVEMGKHLRIDKEMNEATGIEAVTSTPSRYKIDFKGSSKMIRVTDITLKNPDDKQGLLLDGADLKLDPGHRYALIGRNGTGKSTFLSRIVQGHLQNFPSHISTALIQQELVGDHRTCFQTMMDSLVEQSLMQEESSLLATLLDRLNLLHSEWQTRVFESTNLSSCCSSPLDERIDPLEYHIEVLRNAGESPSWVKAHQRLIETFDLLKEFEPEESALRARTILCEMGFKETEIDVLPTSKLSGGWRMRLALAAAILQQPDVLFLDEPTNHLDLEGILWLQRMLSRATCFSYQEEGSGSDSDKEQRGVLDGCKAEDDDDDSALRFTQSSIGTLVIISHDPVFLDRVCTDTIILKDKKLHYFPGNFASFVQAMDNQYQHLQQQLDTQERQKKAIVQSISKAKAKKSSGKTSERGDSNLGSFISCREKALDRLGSQKTVEGKKWKYSLMGERQKVNLPPPEKITRLFLLRESPSTPTSMSAKKCCPCPDSEKFTFENFFAGEIKQDEALVHLSGISLTLSIRDHSGAKVSSKTLFRGAEFTVFPGSRTLLLGPNGVGKSCMMRILAGNMAYSSGEVVRHPNLRMGFFSQHHLESLPLDSTPLQHLRSMASASTTEQDLREQLGRFGLKGSQPSQFIETLSGGEKTRLALAAACWNRPHLLILDEPTNHLDLYSVKALAEAIRSYPGAVVVVSHNQGFNNDILIPRCNCPSSNYTVSFLISADQTFKRFAGTFNDYCSTIRV